jgi:hypothetical protein
VEDDVFSLDVLIQYLNAIEADLREDLDLSGLHSRSPVAHKWKAPMRCWIIREVVARRSKELIVSAAELEISGQALAARIITRSAVETVAVLAYTNYSMDQLALGKLKFSEFSDRTQALLAGSKNHSTPYDAVNVLKMIDRLDKDFGGIRDIYDSLSEFAHPNYDGLVHQYSSFVKPEDRIIFFPKMRAQISEEIKLVLNICVNALIAHYNNRFSVSFDRLERWLIENDDLLT